MRQITWTVAASAAIIAASLAIAPSAGAGMSSSAWRHSYVGASASGGTDAQAKPRDTSAYERRIERPVKTAHTEGRVTNAPSGPGIVGGGCVARIADARPWCGRTETVN